MHDFLTKIKVKPAADGHLDPAEPAPDDNYVAALPGRAWLGIAGPDAARFMQGQFTCDLGEVTARQSRYGAHCTPAGRMVGTFRLCQLGENDFLLGLPADNAATVAANIKKYIVFSRATLVAADDAWLALGLAGAGAVEVVAAVFGSVPEQVLGQVGGSLGVCTRVPGKEPRFEAWLPATRAAAFWRAATGLLAPGSSRCWELAQIRTGIAEIRAATSDLLLPQSLGLERWGGISYTKGCYTGQEIVARTRYKGQLKRLLYRFRGAISTAPAIGESLLQAGGDKLAGVVVAAVAAGDGQVEGLAVVNSAALEHGVALAGHSQALELGKIES